MSKTVNIESKTLLAKLLATEDIRVEHQAVHTAMFNTESRTLTLPMWKDMDNHLYDMLVGHEVGHALFTERDVVGAIKTIDPDNEFGQEVVMDYLNVVEDARIERLMQVKFPGLRRDFRKAYNDLVKRDFFGIAGKEVSEMGFIDRINLYFKVGSIMDVPFDTDEQTFVDQIAECETFEDVMNTVWDLLDYASQKKKQQEEQQQVAAESGDGPKQPGQTSGDGGESGDSDNESDTNMASDGDGDTNEQEGQSGACDGASVKSTGGCSLERSETQQAFDKSMQEITAEAREDCPVRYVTMPEVDLKHVVITTSELLKIFRNNDANRSVKGPLYTDFAVFQKEASKIVGNMVKRFEMKKAADEHKRTMTSDSGILDTVKMINYKWSDDIFLKSTEVADGKSHGLVMVVDWSGSMAPMIHDTVKQLMILVMFCKQVGIPYDVYAFTSHWRSNNPNIATIDEKMKRIIPNPKVGDVLAGNEATMVNIMSSEVKKSDWVELMTYMFSHSRGLDYDSRTHYDVVPREFELGGTPLEDAIFLTRDILKMFKKRHGVQIVNAVFLTDGAGAGGPIRSGMVYNGASWEYDSGWKGNCNVIRTSTGELVGPTDGSHIGWQHNYTEYMLQWLKVETGVGAVGIFITPSKRNVEYAISDKYKNTNSLTKAMETFKQNDAIAFGEYNGYSQYIMMMVSNKKIKGLEDVESGAKPMVVANAMIREAKKTKGMTRIMDSFVDTIAVEG
jgi:hypothetical protein